MNISTQYHKKTKNVKQEKILLGLLPYWTPLIPPLGISSLKTFLHQHGHRVKTLDLNIEGTFQDINNQYYNCLSKCIPEEMKGNFYNLGNDVIREQMMAHINHTDRSLYIELVRQLIEKNFFITPGDGEINHLAAIIDDFYIALKKYILRLLEVERPSVLGLSVYNGNLPASLFVFKLAKELYPGIVTIMGGAVFTNQLEVDSPSFKYFLEKTPYIDKIIVGEGEILFLNWLRGELPAAQKVYTLKDINYEILDLSGLGVLDFSDFDIQFYPYLTNFASRSCPFQCAFCSETVYWGKYRKKETAQVTSELIQLYRKYRRQLFFFGDSLLNPFIADLVSELLKLDTSIYWDGYLKASQTACDPEEAFRWRQGGFYRARLGLESGSPHVLDLMGKRISPDLMKQALASLAYAGIKTTTYWLVGHPGETEEDFQQTLDFLEESKDNIYEAECNPFRFYLTGQVKSDDWAKKNKVTLLYPGKAIEMLMVQTMIMECQPSRDKIYDRVRRFVQHCKKLGIPNPYSLDDINKADERWLKLQKNAVPPFLKFREPGVIFDECRYIKKLYTATDTHTQELQDGWAF
jgi:radical SAM superfamily enzyme YgiQ (UPF0313 family)